MIFLGPLYPRSLEPEIQTNTKKRGSAAANVFQWNILDGMAQNGVQVSVYNVLPVGTWPRYYAQAVLPDREWENRGSVCREFGGPNVPVLKQAVRAWKLRKALSCVQKGEKVVFCTAYLPFLYAIGGLPKSCDVTAIVTDLPEYADMHQVNFLRKILRRVNNGLIYHYMKRVNRFVVLTEQMKEPLGVGNRPAMVMEGICMAEAGSVWTEKAPERVLLYTGRLNRRYGLEELLEAFSQMQGDDLRLWICGAGEMEEQLRQAASSDPRIVFFGFQPHEKALELQRRATVVVNPRNARGEYTKYSFPSKTMEYMASGTPVVMYPLPGVPREYDAYLNYVTGEGTEALAQTLERLCAMPREELNAMGARARGFVLSQKSAARQAERILSFINGEEV